MEAALRQVRQAVRGLSRTPGFTITVVLTLAVGIGSSTAVFSAIDAILLRPLPFPEADRLVLLMQSQPGVVQSAVAPVRLEDWNRSSATFDGITGHNVEDVSDTTADLPERVRRATVMPRFLDVLGAAPVLGRGFVEAEHRFGGPRAVLISERYWRTRLGADANLLDRVVRIADQSYSIVGVMPASFTYPDRDVDLWAPYAIDSPFTQSRRLVSLLGVGRLQPGVTAEQARADLARVQARLAAEYPDSDAGVVVHITPLKDALVGQMRGSLWLLFGAVSVLLLIACTNIGALLLSRATQREQEIAVRYALGASRMTVIVNLLTEAAVLAFAGAGVGLLVAVGASAAFRLLAPDWPRLDEVAIDARMLAYAMGSAAIVTVLCGLFPAIRGAAGSAALARGAGNRTQVSPRNRTQWLLVGVQVALSVTLLIGAGLLLRSAEAIARVDLGFDPSRVLILRVSASLGEPGGIEARGARIERTVAAIRTLPSVEAAAASWWLPGVGTRFQGEFDLVEGRPDAEPRMIGEWRTVTPGYFATMQIPVVAGDLCRLDGGTGEVMVNRSFSDRYLPGRAPVGLHLRDITAASSNRIAGVVGNAREIAAHVEPVPTVYFCFSAAVATPWFLVRTRGEPEVAVTAVREALNEIEPLRAVYEIAPFEESLGEAYAQNRLRMVLLLAFAVTALALACLGVYGTLSYVVSLRRREVGLRMALGALQRNVVLQFLWRALRVVALALVAGVVVSFSVAHVLSGMLYGVTPADPITLVSVVLIVMAVSALAAIVPALRASAVQPMQVLREG